MIKVIGAKRLIVLAILIAANAVLAGVLYQYFLPEIKDTERHLRIVRSQISSKETDISRMQIEFDQLDEQQALFDALKADGFFTEQSRRDAEDVFLQAKDNSDIVSASVKIGRGQKTQDDEATKAGHVILISPIEIELEAVEDRDIYSYLYILQKLFPGHLTVDEVFIERTAQLNDVLLRAIATGQKPPLVKAQMTLSWRTMVPSDDAEQDGGF